MKFKEIMKKGIIGVLAMTIATANLAGSVSYVVSAEEETEVTQDNSADSDVNYAGTWYADILGMTMTLEIKTDGTYTVSANGQEESGVWTTHDGYLVLDENADSELTMEYIADEDILSGYESGIHLKFYRTQDKINEQMAGYEVNTDVTESDFDGVWTASEIAYSLAEGYTIPAEFAEISDTYLIVKDGKLSFYLCESGENTANVNDLAYTFEDGTLKVNVTHITPDGEDYSDLMSELDTEAETNVDESIDAAETSAETESEIDNSVWLIVSKTQNGMVKFDIQTSDYTPTFYMTESSMENYNASVEKIAEAEAEADAADTDADVDDDTVDDTAVEVETEKD